MTRLIPFRFHFLLISILCLSSLLSSNVFCQDKKDDKTSNVDPKLKTKLRSPFHTMLTFLDAIEKDDMEMATKCMDFPKIVGQVGETKRNTQASKLHQLIVRMWEIDLRELPKDSKRATPYVLGEDAWFDSDYGINLEKTLSAEQIKLDADRIQISLSEDGLWRFSQSTLDQLDDLYDKYKDYPDLREKKSKVVKDTTPMWVAKQFKAPIFHKKFFLIHNYQWICIFVLIVAGLLACYIVLKILNLATQGWFKYVDVERKARRNLWVPTGWMCAALVWYFGTSEFIDLPQRFQAVLLIALKVFGVIAAVWTAFRAVDVFSSYLLGRARKTPSKFDDLLVPLSAKALKFASVLLGMVLFVDFFSMDWKALLGGFGLGGIALAVASKDMVSNWLGSVTVLTDRPFEIGDWVLTEGVEGTVETVGMRSSRIRTFYNSLVVMPNSRLATAVVDNMGKRRYRRFKTMISVEYDTTAEQIDAFCEGIRELIRRRSFTRKDYYQVYLNQFAPSSLDILLYCFFECPDWSMELSERHQLMLDIMKLAEKLKIRFAFPTQTIHNLTVDTDEISQNGLKEPPFEIGKKFAAEISREHST